MKRAAIASADKNFQQCFLSSVPLENLEVCEAAGNDIFYSNFPPMLIFLTTLLGPLSSMFHSRVVPELENLALLPRFARKCFKLIAHQGLGRRRGFERLCAAFIVAPGNSGAWFGRHESVHPGCTRGASPPPGNCPSLLWSLTEQGTKVSVSAT